MLFNSVAFLLFFPTVFALYWTVCAGSKKAQNSLLIVCSYFFYACWDWRFLFLLIFSTVLDYASAIVIEGSDSQRKRKLWLWISIGINLGFLGVFKYYDFFATSMAEMLSGFGISADPRLLNLVLPVGISFYTFHGLSYIIDIYFRRITAERNFVDYSLFVCYFPLLVAGPIERATHLLPQLKVKRAFDYDRAKQGVSLVLMGFFKKVVVADNCAFFVNQLFENYESRSAAELWMGAILFAFQIYGDFSGYTDIARGTSKLLGIELLKNFNYPYFSKDIADFWRRWHISLSSWFRDYVYVPLGGSRGSRALQIRNVFVIFLISGFWHGANWTFIIWGGIHACLFLPLVLLKRNRRNTTADDHGFKDLPSIVGTFLLVCVAWIFFRADHVTDAVGYLQGMFDFTSFSLNFFTKNAKFILLTAITMSSVVLLTIVEWNQFQRGTELRYSKLTAFGLLAGLLFMGVFREAASFIYFQF